MSITALNNKYVELYVKFQYMQLCNNIKQLEGIELNTFNDLKSELKHISKTLIYEIKLEYSDNKSSKTLINDYERTLKFLN